MDAAVGVWVARTELVGILEVVLGMTCSIIAGPQETKNKRIRLTGSKRTMLGSFFFMVYCLSNI
jgi:hypothetical protein